MSSEFRVNCQLSSHLTLSITQSRLALLPSVCSTAPEDLSVLAGWECSQEAGVCGPGAVCCEGVCHGLPTLNQTLSDQCPAGRL